ncbi:MAG: MarR family transcriptional regulator [Desulfovibrio sp.]|nr:MarR family transcriptional regulator [Desulfovibrio sp.]
MARVITRLAEEAFKPTGLSPSHAFVLMTAASTPGIGPGELAAKLALAPSTVTRFVDALVAKGLLTRTAEGRAARLAATPAGLALLKGLEKSWKRLHTAYSEVLGPEGDRLALGLHAACCKLEGQDQ